MKPGFFSGLVAITVALVGLLLLLRVEHPLWALLWMIGAVVVYYGIFLPFIRSR